MSETNVLWPAAVRRIAGAMHETLRAARGLQDVGADGVPVEGLLALLREQRVEELAGQPAAQAADGWWAGVEPLLPELARELGGPV
jgi:hypothetical protein